MTNDGKYMLLVLIIITKLISAHYYYKVNSSLLKLFEQARIQRSR